MPAPRPMPSPSPVARPARRRGGAAAGGRRDPRDDRGAARPAGPVRCDADRARACARCAVDPELVCDLVVEASALTARTTMPNSGRLPDTGLAPSWAGVSPPRSGWVGSAGQHRGIRPSPPERSGESPRSRSRVPQNPGEDAVRAVRARVWGAPDDALGGLPLGVAFAAFALGFIVGEEEARVRASGTWTRVSLRARSRDRARPRPDRAHRRASTGAPAPDAASQHAAADGHPRCGRPPRDAPENRHPPTNVPSRAR